MLREDADLACTHVFLKCQGENNQVRVCTNTTCRKQGSAQIVRHLKELVDPAQVFSQ